MWSECRAGLRARRLPQHDDQSPRHCRMGSLHRFVADGRRSIGGWGLEEMWRSFSKAAFVRSLQRLIPEIKERRSRMGSCRRASPSRIDARATSSTTGSSTRRIASSTSKTPPRPPPPRPQRRPARRRTPGTAFCVNFGALDRGLSDRTRRPLALSCLLLYTFIA